MANVVPADRSAGSKAGDFGKGLGYDTSKTSGGETLTARADITASELAILDAAGYTAEADVEAALAELYTYKPLFSSLAADSADVNASVVLVDSGLVVTVPVAGTYALDAVVLVTTAAAADVSFKWGGTATVTATIGVSDLFYAAGPQSGGAATVATEPELLPTSWTTEVETPFATTSALTDQPFIFKGKLVVTVAGTIKLQFTQGTSDASNTHIDKGSYLILKRVA